MFIYMYVYTYVYTHTAAVAAKLKFLDKNPANRPRELLIEARLMTKEAATSPAEGCIQLFDLRETEKRKQGGCLNAYRSIAEARKLEHHSPPALKVKYKGS